jgi:uncharacterized protein YdcH (DUF465 family)
MTRGLDLAHHDKLLAAEREHKKLHARLEELGRRAYPTPTEQREIAEIKKLKLRAKDEINALSRRTVR